MQFTLGACVRLNSGGPEMLVVDLLGPTAVVTSWRDSNGDVNESAFPNRCLQASAKKAA